MLQALLCCTILLKTMWGKKKKLLVTSTFSFSHSVFYHFGKHPAIFIKFKIVICKLFKPLPMPIFGSSNSAANENMMSKIWTNGGSTIQLSRKHFGSRRNGSLRAISSFPTMFFNSCLLFMHQNKYLWSKVLSLEVYNLLSGKRLTLHWNPDRMF